MGKRNAIEAVLVKIDANAENAIFASLTETEGKGRKNQESRGLNS
jgi:hypothetical protein